MSLDGVEARKQRVALERIADAVEEIAAGFRAPKVTLGPAATQAAVQLTTPAQRIGQGYRASGQRLDENEELDRARGLEDRLGFDPEPMGEDG